MKCDSRVNKYFNIVAIKLASKAQGINFLAEKFGSPHKRAFKIKAEGGNKYFKGYFNGFCSRDSKYFDFFDWETENRGVNFFHDIYVAINYSILR